MGKRIINIFLVLVLSVQMLPIQQMGKLLFSSTFTEEIPHSIDGAKAEVKKAEGKTDFITTPVFSLNSSVIYLCHPQPILADAIPQNHTADILVPPPNYL